MLAHAAAFLAQHCPSASPVESWTTAGATPPSDITNTMPMTGAMIYFLKDMHDKRTLQAQCQFMPRVYAVGTGFLLTRSCGCGFLRGPRNPTRTPTPYTHGKNPRGLPIPVHITTWDRWTLV